MKISEMPIASGIDGDELVPIIQQGVNKSATVQLLTGGKVQADVFSWTGNLLVPEGGWINFAELIGLARAVDGGAGILVQNNAFLFPAYAGWSFVSLGTRINGTIEGPLGTERSWRIQQRRPDGVTVVGSQESIKIESNSIGNRDCHLASYTNGVDDPFSVAGIQIGLHNPSTYDITLTSVSVRLQRIIN